MQWSSLGTASPFTAGVGMAPGVTPATVPGVGGVTTACSPIYGQVAKACAGTVPTTAVIPTQTIIPTPTMAPTVQYGKPIVAGLPAPTTAAPAAGAFGKAPVAGTFQQAPVAGAFGKASPFCVSPTGKIAPTAGWGAGSSLTAEEIARW